MSTTYRDGKAVTARCWLLHRWAPWEQYDWRGHRYPITGGSPVEVSMRRQRRTCVHCHKEQDELVRRG